jgi:hypothetical protein
MEEKLPNTMINFVEGHDNEINAFLNDLRNAVSLKVDTLAISLNQNDIMSLCGYFVVEVSDVQRCIEAGVNPQQIIAIGYSSSSYYNHATLEGCHRHYVTSRIYNQFATELPLGYSSASRVRQFMMPKRIGLICDSIVPHLRDLDEYTYIYNPSDFDTFDVLVYASHNDRFSRVIRRAISEGIPIIGYTSVPLIAELVEVGLALELKESDDFEITITNTICYIGSSIPWQMTNSVALFKYAKDFMNWDRWIYELEHI